MSDPYVGRLIRLRAREPEDKPAYLRWFNDWMVVPGIEVRYPLSIAEQNRRFEDLKALAANHAQFTIETLREKRVIGSCSITGGPPEDRRGELGITVGERSFWDGGYGTDTIRVLCRVGFEVMNLHRVELTVFSDNPRAVRCYEKVGFVHEGTAREFGFWAGAYRDLHYMSVFRDEVLLEAE